MDISKLPKWAQERIKTLERQRDDAVKALKEFNDEQTQSPFFYEYEDYIGTGESSQELFKRKYVQTHRITVNYNGVELEITLRDNIELQWNDTGYHLREVAFVPTSFQSARLMNSSSIK